MTSETIKRIETEIGRFDHSSRVGALHNEHIDLRRLLTLLVGHFNGSTKLPALGRFRVETPAQTIIDVSAKKRGADRVFSTNITLLT